MNGGEYKHTHLVRVEYSENLLVNTEKYTIVRILWTECIDWGCPVVTILMGVVVRKLALPDIGAVPPAYDQLIAPRIQTIGLAPSCSVLM